MASNPGDFENVTFVDFGTPRSPEPEILAIDVDEADIFFASDRIDWDSLVQPTAETADAEMAAALSALGRRLTS